MLHPSPYEVGYEAPPHGLYKCELYFDDLVSRNRLDDAQAFIGDALTDIVEFRDMSRYVSEFYRLAVKEAALPLYRKYQADYAGEPYLESRSAIPGIYTEAARLMGVLLEYADYESSISQLSSQYKKLVGDLSELTVFALAVRPLTGYGDDYTIMPSSMSQDRSSKDTKNRNLGFDFIVHDRESDTLKQLQVKTNREREPYHPDIAILRVADFVGRHKRTLPELQRAIAADGERSDPMVAELSSAVEEYLRALPAHAA